MKLGKQEQAKMPTEDLCWKVRDPVQSFVLLSYNMHELRNQHVFFWLVPQYGVNNCCVLCTVKA